jgi:DNA-binding MurR/RpiR family transcriptional regulator
MIMSRASVTSHVQAIAAALADPSVAAITISHSGSTVETLTATRPTKEGGATTIAIINCGKTPLLAYTTSYYIRWQRKHSSGPRR